MKTHIALSGEFQIVGTMSALEKMNLGTPIQIKDSTSKGIFAGINDASLGISKFEGVLRVLILENNCDGLHYLEHQILLSGEIEKYCDYNSVITSSDSSYPKYQKIWQEATAQ